MHNVKQKELHTKECTLYAFIYNQFKKDKMRFQLWLKSGWLTSHESQMESHEQSLDRFYNQYSEGQMGSLLENCQVIFVICSLFVCMSHISIKRNWGCLTYRRKGCGTWWLSLNKYRILFFKKGRKGLPSIQTNARSNKYKLSNREFD